MATTDESLRGQTVSTSERDRPPTIIDEQVGQMFALVHQAVASATDIFLSADRDAARLLVQRDQLIDAIHDKTERAAVSALKEQNGYNSDQVDRLTLVLQILPELERSGDLAEHIASHAVQGLARWLTPRARNLVEQMGSLGAQMWELAAEGFVNDSDSLTDVLRARDDEIDDLHVCLTAELAASGVAVPVAIEMALVARYFERLGDHAYNVARRMHHSGRGS